MAMDVFEPSRDTNKCEYVFDLLRRYDDCEYIFNTAYPMNPTFPHPTPWTRVCGVCGY